MAKSSFDKWVNSSESASFTHLCELMKKHEDLVPEYDHLMVQHLLISEEADKAENLTGKIFDRAPTESPYYLDFARTSITISHGEYEEALKQAFNGPWMKGMAEGIGRASANIRHPDKSSDPVEFVRYFAAERYPQKGHLEQAYEALRWLDVVLGREYFLWQLQRAAQPQLPPKHGTKPPSGSEELFGGVRDLLADKEDELDVALALVPYKVERFWEVGDRQCLIEVMAHLAELIVEEVKSSNPD